MACDVGLGKHLIHARPGSSIRKEGVNLLYIAEAYHGLPTELGVISHNENLAGIFNNRPVRPVVAANQPCLGEYIEISGGENGLDKPVHLKI